MIARPANHIDAPMPLAAATAGAEIERIRAALGHQPRIEHIGSTAVPGLAAKPIIDLLVGVEESTWLSPARAVLSQRLGYLEDGSRPGHSWHRWPATGPRRFHVHVVEFDGPVWRARVAFRDALRRSPMLRSRYEDLKRTLAAEHPDDMSAYTAGKRAFVESTIAPLETR